MGPRDQILPRSPSAGMRDLIGYGIIYAVLRAWRTWSQRLKRETLVLYFACRDPRTPGLAKVIAAGVVAYAFSPIDLIPDFVPVLGYLDDLVIVPLGVVVVLRLVPAVVLADCRRQAQERAERPVNWIAATVIVVTWIGAAVLGAYVLIRAVE